jgi:signal peptidase II
VRRDYFIGPLTRLGLVVAVVICALDQALKVWLLQAYRLAERGVVDVAPGVSLVLTWNPGISYGLFRQDSVLGRSILIAITAVAVLLLWVWLARAGSRLTALALGLILGGAIGNAIDRVLYGAVVDFVLLHLTTAEWTFNWYVFNLADAAIVAGVAGLLYEALFGDHAAKAP